MGTPFFLLNPECNAKLPDSPPPACKLNHLKAALLHLKQKRILALNVLLAIDKIDGEPSASVLFPTQERVRPAIDLILLLCTCALR